LSCKDRDATYIGQTGRKLKTQIDEHRYAGTIYAGTQTQNQSVIIEHRIKFNHKFD